MGTSNTTNQSSTAAVYISVDKVAQRWDRSGMHVRRLIAAGRLLAHSLGTSKDRPSWAIKLSDLEAFERETLYKP